MKYFNFLGYLGFEILSFNDELLTMLWEEIEVEKKWKVKTKKVRRRRIFYNDFPSFFVHHCYSPLCMISVQVLKVKIFSGLICTISRS